jgi:uncharacterized membrane-anchored protein YitT (DUF2179 family)
MVAQDILRGVKDDFYDLAHSINSWRFWQTVAVMVVGLTLFGISINAILIPHKFIASGATGIAMAIYYLFDRLSVGVIYWIINVPVLIIGWRAMSLKFVVLAVLGVFISGATLQMTRGISIPTSDPLMASIIAGVLSGTGVGLYLRYGGSAGGMDIVAAVLRRKVGIPMGTTFISINFLNVVAGGLISHSLDIAFYTFIAMFVHSRMVERMQAGFSARKACFIVTSQPDRIAEQIIRTLNRGVTYLHGSGGMSQRPTRVVYTVINMIELARLKEIIFDLDPAAFISINNASEVIGNRFISWADEGFGHGVTPRRKVLPVLAAAGPDEDDTGLSPGTTADTPSTAPLPPPGG